MQPDSSATFISSKNKRVWAGKRGDLARHDEVLHNLARQAGVPPLPQTRATRLIRLYASYARVGGMLASTFVLGLVIMWFISVEFWRYLGECVLFIGLTVIAVPFLLGDLSTVRRLRDQIVYPPCVLQLYRQLIDSGQLTVGEVHTMEALAESKCLIHYQFTLPTNNRSITGEYVTDQQFPAGTKIAVIYLDATCHALL